VKLDAPDLSILRVLIEDGRASLREVAMRTSLSTPTVSQRLARMQKSGLIRGFIPVIDPGASHQVLALVKLKVPGSSARSVASKLAQMEEVAGVYLTTGDANLTIRVSSEDVRSLQRFLTGKILGSARGEVVSGDIITETIKEQPAPRLTRGAILKLKCDFCGGEVTADRPYNVRVGTTVHYFCCRTCRHSYLEKNRSKILSARLKMGPEGPYKRKGLYLSAFP